MNNKIRRDNGFEQQKKGCGNETLLGKELPETGNLDISALKNDKGFQELFEKQRKAVADYMGVKPDEIERAFANWSGEQDDACMDSEALRHFGLMEGILIGTYALKQMPSDDLFDTMEKLNPEFLKYKFEVLFIAMFACKYCSEESEDLSIDMLMSEADIENPEVFCLTFMASIYFEILAGLLEKELDECQKISFERSMEADWRKLLEEENKRLRKEADGYSQELKKYRSICSKEKRKKDEEAGRQKEHVKQIELLTKQLEDKKKLIEEQRQMLSDREKYVSWLETESETEPRAEAAEGRQACGKKIVFVGGVPEVVAKLKSVFYKSVFVNSETADIPQKIDGIAMFPKTISRGLFFKYMALAREKNLEVVYCKGTNTGVIFNKIKKALRRE